MTTIAYKDGVLAADTAVFDTGVEAYVSDCVKIVARENWAVGVAGHFHLGGLIADWILAGAPVDAKPPFDPKDDRWEALKIAGPYLWHLDGKGIQRPLAAPFLAIGCGRQLALGAMWHGATAVEAVKIAIQTDAYTDGDIVYWQDGKFGIQRTGRAMGRVEIPT